MIGICSVAGRRAGIREGLACLRHEAPVIARRTKRQLEDAERVVVAHFAARCDPNDWMMRLPSGTDDEFANAGVGSEVAVVPPGTGVRRATRAGNVAPIVMVSRSRVRDRLDPSPGRIVGLQERVVPSTLVLVIAQREDRTVATAYHQVRRRPL